LITDSLWLKVEVVLKTEFLVQNQGSKGPKT